MGTTHHFIAPYPLSLSFSVTHALIAVSPIIGLDPFTYLPCAISRMRDLERDRSRTGFGSSKCATFIDT